MCIHTHTHTHTTYIIIQKANANKGVRCFGVSGPQWKKSCVGPHIKYTNTNEN